MYGLLVGFGLMFDKGEAVEHAVLRQLIFFSFFFFFFL